MPKERKRTNVAWSGTAITHKPIRNRLASQCSATAISVLYGSNSIEFFDECQSNTGKRNRQLCARMGKQTCVWRMGVLPNWHDGSNSESRLLRLFVRSATGIYSVFNNDVQAFEVIFGSGRLRRKGSPTSHSTGRAISKPLIENLCSHGGSCAPVNSSVGLLARMCKREYVRRRNLIHRISELVFPLILRIQVIPLGNQTYR